MCKLIPCTIITKPFAVDAGRRRRCHHPHLHADIAAATDACAHEQHSVVAHLGDPQRRIQHGRLHQPLHQESRFERQER